MGFPDSSIGKEYTCNARDPGLIPELGKSSWEGKGYPFQYSWASPMAQLVKKLPAFMQQTWVRSLGWEDSLEKGKATTPVFWPGEFHGLYSPWGHKQLNMTEWLSLHFEALLVQTVVSIVVEKNWVLSVDQCLLQELQFLMHLINLLSTPLRCNGFIGIQRGVVDQTTKEHQTIKQWPWPSFGAILGLESAMELLIGFPGCSDDKESACNAGDAS